MTDDGVIQDGVDVAVIWGFVFCGLLGAGTLLAYATRENAWSTGTTVGPCARAIHGLLLGAIFTFLFGLAIHKTVDWRKRIHGINRRAEANYSDSETRGGASDVGTAANTGSTATTGSTPGLEVITQSEPIKAWRGIRLVADKSTVGLAALNENFGSVQPAEHRAICYKREQWYRYNVGIYNRECPPEDHEAPQPHCDCGFYGVKDKTGALGGGVLAEVDFYGRIIEHELGYRAEFQRILSIQITKPPYCTGTFICDGTPEIVVFVGDGPDTPPSVMCIECAIKHERVATLGQIASRLGVETRWTGDV